MKTRNLLLGAVIFACAIPVFGQSVEPKAGTWKTWIISSAKDYRVPSPELPHRNDGERAALFQSASVRLQS